MKRRGIKILLTLCALGMFAFLFTLWQVVSEQGSRTGWTGISLVKPAFAQKGEAIFLEQEAGIAAYTDLGRQIDITSIRDAFKTVEKGTDTYVVGSIPVLGYEEYGKEQVHCFVHRDGWIMAYYPNGEPTAKMVNWQKLGKSKLDIGLTVVCNNAGASLPSVKYYHFKYPDATKLMVIGKYQSRYFRMMIPDSFIVYERSWSTTWDYGRYVEIDGTGVSDKKSASGEYGTYGLATPLQLTIGDFHTVRPIRGNCAIVIVYRES